MCDITHDIHSPSKVSHDLSFDYKKYRSLFAKNQETNSIGYGSTSISSEILKSTLFSKNNRLFRSVDMYGISGVGEKTKKPHFHEDAAF